MSDAILQSDKDFFERKVRTYGATPQGLDYSTEQRQLITFQQLTKVWEAATTPRSVLDYGCGYGDLIAYLDQHGYTAKRYVGYDIAPGMIEEATRLYGGRENYHFTTELDDLGPADYVIAGGVFNMKLETSNADWLGYVLGQIERLWSLCEQGMAFNMLTKYSDFDKMRPDLYYADPTFLFDYCKQRLSRKVALLHDYEAYESTILVRR